MHGDKENRTRGVGTSGVGAKEDSEDTGEHFLGA